MPSIYLSKEEVALLSSVLGHCTDHNTWMVEVFKHGDKLYELNDKIQEANNTIISKKQSGRPKKVGFEKIQRLKASGMTQEQVARELNISLSTVRRYWKAE